MQDDIQPAEPQGPADKIRAELRARRDQKPSLRELLLRYPKEVAIDVLLDKVVLWSACRVDLRELAGDLAWQHYQSRIDALRAEERAVWVEREELWRKLEGECKPRARLEIEARRLKLQERADRLVGQVERLWKAVETAWKARDEARAEREGS